MNDDVAEVIGEGVEGGEMEGQCQAQVSKEAGWPVVEDGRRHETSENDVIPDGRPVIEMEGCPKSGQINGRAGDDNQEEKEGCTKSRFHLKIFPGEKFDFKFAMP